MRCSRSLTALLCAASLAAAPASALAQSAGDEQYQDPFADDPAQGQTQTSPESNLTQSPQSTAPQTRAQAPAQTTTPSLQEAPATAAPGARLADTGIDARLFLGVGAALLLTGVGLRLRTQPERF